jgi:hypothetical protein
MDYMESAQRAFRKSSVCVSMSDKECLKCGYEPVNIK